MSHPSHTVTIIKINVSLARVIKNLHSGAILATQDFSHTPLLICNWLLYVSQPRSQLPFACSYKGSACCAPGVKVKPDDTEVYVLP